jgi:hypothetical protein
MQVLLVRAVLKGMGEIVLRGQATLRQHTVFLLVLEDEPEAQEDDGDGQADVAAQVDAEGDEVAGGVSVEEDLGAYIVFVSLVSFFFCVRWGGEGQVGLPMELPTAQETKVAATTVDFLVAPAMLRETMERQRVWADQKERVM